MYKRQVYDRAATQSDGKFKRWWLQLPRPATVSGKRATMTSASGQQLFVTSLLPANAVLTAVNTNELLIEDTAAANDPMKVRLRVDGGDAQAVEFLHVLQGADAGANADPLTLVQDPAGAVRGVAIGARAVLFVRAPASGALSYTLPAAVTEQIVTGLAKNASYTVKRMVSGGTASITLQPGAGTATDGGGVLLIGP